MRSYDAERAYDFGEATLNDLPDIAAELERQLVDAGFGKDMETNNALALVEEVGEFIQAYRRWRGLSRRTGPFSDVEDELADVIITAFIAGRILGVNIEEAIRRKLNVIFTRGWKEGNGNTAAGS